MELFYNKENYNSELKKRIDSEINKKYLTVDYYRIHTKYSFSLPVMCGWDKNLPVKVDNIEPYPYAIWLLWELKKRWDTLFIAYKLYDNLMARDILENEILYAFQWDKYAIGRNAYLGTAHFALCVAKYYIFDTFSLENKEKIKELSKVFLDKHFMLWLREYKMIDKSKVASILHNIQVILVFSGLALAKCVDYAYTNEIYSVAETILDLYKGSRGKDIPFTEMAAYDAFTLDTILGYVYLYSKQTILNEYRDDLFDVLYSLTDTTIPGRCDILAPIGDVEEEMQFHSSVIYRLSKWFNYSEGLSILYRINPGKISSQILYEAIVDDTFDNTLIDKKITRKNAGTCALRSGMKLDDVLLCTSVAKWNEGHVHYDAGSFIFAYLGEICITDPGYQQYIKGEEREFTYGTYSHNAPIINGKQQNKHKCEIIDIHDDYLKLDISNCYDLRLEKVFRTFELKNKIAYINDEYYDFDQSSIEYSFTISNKAKITIDDGVLCLYFDKFICKLKASFNFDGCDIVYPHGGIDKNRIIHSCTIEKNQKISFKIWIEEF